jgi:hypothetical protein
MTTTKNLTCCHCGQKNSKADPVRVNWQERSRNGVARCVDRTRCWHRFDRQNGLPEIK